MKSIVLHVSTCSQHTRGHRAIGRRILDAAGCAGIPVYSAIAQPPSAQLHATVKQLQNDGHYVIVVVDFPDLPSSPELRAIIDDADQSVYLGMVSTPLYRRAFESLGEYHRYSVVVSCEMGVSKLSLTDAGQVKLLPADVMIPPLIQTPTEVGNLDLQVWSQILKKRHWRPGQRVLYWTHGGYTPEMQHLAGRLTPNNTARAQFNIQDSDLIITSLEVEDHLRSALVKLGEAELIDEVAARPLTDILRYGAMADGIIASPGYSTFWELMSRDWARARVVMWYKLERAIEAIDARLALLQPDKRQILAKSSARLLRTEPNAGVLALADVLKGLADVNRRNRD